MVPPWDQVTMRCFRIPGNHTEMILLLLPPPSFKIWCVKDPWICLFDTTPNMETYVLSRNRSHTARYLWFEKIYRAVTTCTSTYAKWEKIAQVLMAMEWLRQKKRPEFTAVSMQLCIINAKWELSPKPKSTVSEGNYISGRQFYIRNTNGSNSSAKFS